jgi:DNA-binding NarL/FixJ family response regulator
VEEHEGRIRVLILDGHPSSAQGLAAILGPERDIDVVGVATSLTKALALDETPDVAVVDFVALNEGPAAIRMLAETYSGLRVAVHTASERPDDLYRTMTFGARAYLSKRAPLQTLLSAVRMIATGEIVVGPHLVASLLRRPAGEPVHLSEMERDILSLVAEGADNALIAKRMAMSESTVKRRLSQIEGKLQARNRIEAAIQAARLGLI